MADLTPVVALDGVSGPGSGPVTDLEGSYAVHTMHVRVNSSTPPNTYRVDLVGAHTTEDSFVLGSVTGPASTGKITVETVIRYVWAQVSELDGGTSVEINATIASA